MCGIAGILLNEPSCDRGWLYNECSNMVSAIMHRGPDFQDVWVDEKAGVGFAHARLSIFDLSPAGNQPMHTTSTRYTIVFNGEIYNWKDLKTRCSKYDYKYEWRSSTDTETLLFLIENIGLDKTLPMLRGMFAFCLWDKHLKKLTLARDRIGQKPLYYSIVSQGLVFASELKALTSLSFFDRAINHEAKAHMLRFGYVSEHASIYQNVFKIVPGSYLEWFPGKTDFVRRYWWNLSEKLLNDSDRRDFGSEKALTDEFGCLLSASVNEQMQSDVSIGAFLSGGIDSSAVVATMCKNNSKQIKTFTIGFDELNYDEAAHARKVANFFGTDHHEETLSSKDILNIVPDLAFIYDEPFGDSSQLPTVLLSQMVKKEVSVCLSGDGGDELFGGYNRYVWANTFSRLNSLSSPRVRGVMSRLLMVPSQRFWDTVLNCLRPLLPSRFRVHGAGDKIHKIANIILAAGETEIYLKLISQWQGDLSAIGWSKNFNSVGTLFEDVSSLSYQERIMFLDMLSYLPSDILVKVDRASMRFGLETRMPFLDERVMDFAIDLPLQYKIKNGKGKHLVREYLKGQLPETLFNRPKQGFGVPIGDWLRDSLKDWADDLLDQNELSDEAGLDGAEIRRVWGLHQNGGNFQYAIWNILMFQSWRRAWC